MTIILTLCGPFPFPTLSLPLPLLTCPRPDQQLIDWVPLSFFCCCFATDVYLWYPVI